MVRVFRETGLHDRSTPNAVAIPNHADAIANKKSNDDCARLALDGRAEGARRASSANSNREC